MANLWIQKQTMPDRQLEHTFAKPLSYMVLPSALREAYESISKSTVGLDELSCKEFERNLAQNLQNLSQDLIKGTYAPEPLKKIEIAKPDSDEKRPIALSSIKDKIVQRVLFENLNPYYDKTFSNTSYAYRMGKSAMQAINKTTDFIKRKHFFVVKSDINNFFESIDHNLLLKMLSQSIQDKSILRLISLLIQTGVFTYYDYVTHFEGVHQGDILSPLLANIYLDGMDKFLEEKNIFFVRYADDFVMLFQKRADGLEALNKLKEFLKTIKLSLNNEKTLISHVNDGFSFLGVEFRGKNRSIQNERFQKSISKIHQFAKNTSTFEIFIKDINIYLYALKNYSLKIIAQNSTQHQLLQNALVESLAMKVFLSKSSREVNTKKRFTALLEQIRFDLLWSDGSDGLIELVIAKGYEKYLAKRSYKESTAKIDKKKNLYAKKFADETTLHVNTYGIMLSVSKNKFVLKEYGRVKSAYPLNKIKRIIFEGKGFSLSSDVIKKCADNAITIDFIDRDAMPYASLVTYKASIAQNVHKQAMLVNTSKQLDLAKGFIKGKAKNQINYLKYLNKYHALLDKHIDTMEKNFLKIQTARSVKELMGVEGGISVSYWEALRLVLDVPFEKRITKGAKDIVNSSLNYAYAILYGKVQHALVYAGLSLNISFLHTLDGGKPTLTFDMIEEFRTFIVDRTIISMLNKDEPVKLGSDGLLTKSSRQLISKNVKEKLGSYTMWKKESRKVENIILIQCYNLAKVINGEAEKYKPFIGKF